MNGLMEDTERLSLGGDADQGGAKIDELRAVGVNGSGVNGANGHGSGNRASIDGARPNLGVWATAERRASFGDVAAGRKE